MSAPVVARAALAASPAVVALVDDRIFYSVAPQGAARPHLVITGGVERDGRTLAGAERWPEAAFEVIATGDTFTAVDKLGEAVVTALQDASGTFAGKRATFWRDDVGGVDFVPENRTHRRIIGFRCRYR